GALLAAAGARLLATRQPPGATYIILSYFPFADDETVEEELLTTLAAVGVRGGKADPLLIAALKDAKPVRRAAGAFVLGRLADRNLQTIVRPLLRDRDPKVRWRAAQGLVAGKDKEAVATLIALLGDAPVGFALHAEELLCRI